MKFPAMLCPCLLSVLTLLCQTYAYTAPTLNCSSESGRVQGLGNRVTDELNAGDMLFITTEMIGIHNQCPSQSILNITNRPGNESGSIVSINVSLTSYCEDTIDCDFTCASEQDKIQLRASIRRTLTYDLKFAEPSYTASVREDAKKGMKVTLNKDLDVYVPNCNGTNKLAGYGTIYKIVQQGKKTFSWDAETLNNSLHVIEPLDFETRRSYEIRVEAKLRTIGGDVLKGTARTNVTVSVEDIDDNNPVFNISKTETYTLSIPEQNSSYVNTSLSTTPPVSAYDPDFGLNMNISYSIIEQQKPGLFKIDNKSGLISVTQELDYEQQKMYTFYIKAYQDDKPDTATAHTSVTVNVIDVDDHHPEYTPENYSCSIGEHSIIGSVVCDVTAIDKDGTAENNNFTYILWENTLLLSINNEGHILVKNSSSLDRETLGDSITVQVGTKTPNNIYGGNATVTIKLIDINDNNPEFHNDNYSFIVQNTTVGSAVGQVNATDKDEGQNADVTYTMLASISSSSCDVNLPKAPMFDVNSKTGEITIASDEVTFCKQYTAHIQACDNGINKRCSLTVVTIYLPTPPDSVHYIRQNVFVLEGLPKGTAVDIVKCSGANHRYNITGVPEFQIDNNTGMIKTLEVLDRETKERYNFDVNVTSTSGSLICVVSVNVSVQDINDNTPQFLNTPYQFTLSPKPQAGDFLGTIQADDKDLGENANISYYLENRRTSPFELDMFSGNLTIAIPRLLNEDITQAFVTASDNGIPPRKASTAVYIVGKTKENMVPISTPLQMDLINEIKEELAGNISRILNIPVEINDVEEILNKTAQYQSRLHISLAENSTVSRQYFLSQVLNHYEDIRSLLYTSSEKTTNSHSKSTLGASEIGLIVMAGVILIGAIVAIVIVHRQFNSQKRYRQLYETLTKNSSLYESQEITVNIDDQLPECNGTVQSRDIGDEDPPGLAVSAVNPVYQSENTLTPSTGETEDVEDNTAGHQDENTDVKEMPMSASNEQEEYASKETNDQDATEQGDSLQSPPYDYLMLSTNRTENYENADTYIVNDESEILPEQRDVIGTDSGSSKDLINFDSESNGEESDSKNNVEEEPQPDYNEKQVRFHSEVLDADENKLEPLKIKTEEEIEAEGATQPGENNEADESLDNYKDTTEKPDTEQDLDKVNDADDADPVPLAEDTGRLEEEMNSHEDNVPYIEQIQDDFYHGDMQSTYF